MHPQENRCSMRVTPWMRVSWVWFAADSVSSEHRADVATYMRQVRYDTIRYSKFTRGIGKMADLFR